jgi:hypothetical protein
LTWPQRTRCPQAEPGFRDIDNLRGERLRIVGSMDSGARAGSRKQKDLVGKPLPVALSRPRRRGGEFQSYSSGSAESGNFFRDATSGRLYQATARAQQTSKTGRYMSPWDRS